MGCQERTPGEAFAVGRAHTGAGASPHDLRPAWAAIDLDALARNAGRLREQGLALRAVVKADAYGHGAVRVAGRLAEAGIDRFAVALVEEGVELRRAGVGGDILVMGPCRPEQQPTLAEFELVPAVSSRSQLEGWLGAPGGGRRQRLHLKVNTGMNRLGLAPSELGEVLRAVRASAGLELRGLMSHFSSADEPDDEMTRRQADRFARLLELLTAEERDRLEIHIANSAALLHGAAASSNVARPGLALFGYDPARRRSDLEPVMTVSARISQVQGVAAGEAVGYGGRWSAPRAGRIGIVPVGYADGFSWRLGGRGQALVEGRRVGVVGAVSMDMLAVDLTGTDAGEGSEVVLLGRQGGESIDAFELADRAGTLVYEVLCGFGLRLPKVYLAGGREPEVVSRFLR
jgi:alanine racemase